MKNKHQLTAFNIFSSKGKDYTEEQAQYLFDMFHDFTITYLRLRELTNIKDPYIVKSSKKTEGKISWVFDPVSVDSGYIISLQLVAMRFFEEVPNYSGYDINLYIPDEKDRNVMFDEVKSFFSIS